MKQLKEYINEGLISRKVSTKTPIRYRPETKDELEKNIIDLLKKGQTNLNCIDVSKIDDMSFLFWAINKKIQVKDIDISEWDVSNVTDIRFMFSGCKKFNSDLSNWNVSKVTCTRWMFAECEKFNSDLSKWNVSNVKRMEDMFVECKNFNADLSNWNVSNVENMTDMFLGCVTLEQNNKIPDWYKG